MTIREAAVLLNEEFSRNYTDGTYNTGVNEKENAIYVYQHRTVMRKTLAELNGEYLGFKVIFKYVGELELYE